MVWDEKGGRGGGVGATTMIVWDDELSSWVGSVGGGHHADRFLTIKNASR